MALIFNWIYLGTTPTVIDPTEGNSVSENAALLNGTTWGSVGAPLHGRIATFTPVSNTADTTIFETNNNVANDQYSTTIDGATLTLTQDATVVYNATITYVDGTTANVSAVIAQDQQGNLFLAPELVANADTTAYEARPILSITFNSINNNNTNLAANRLVTGWDNGIVEGTAGGDLINAAYVEPINNGSDRIDNGDGLTGVGFNDDVVKAGAGNDTVISGVGNDNVDGGTGADSLDGGAGSDTLFGGGGADTLVGGTEDDSLLGGIGNDSIAGGDGLDTLFGGDGVDSLAGDAGDDTIFGGSGNDTAFGGAGNDLITEAAPTEAAGSLANGTFDSGLTGWTVNNPTGGQPPTILPGDTFVRFNSSNEATFGDSIQQNVTTTPGANYTLSLTAFETGAGVGNHTVRIDILDATGTVIATLTQVINNGASSNLSLNYTALSGTTTVRISNPTSTNTVSTDLGVDSVANTLLPASTAGNDSFFGDAGNDTIISGAGLDTVFGGADDDIIDGGTEADSLDGGDGNDSLLGGTGNSSDTLIGGVGDDTLRGDDGDDQLFGGDGNDSLDGGDGNDSIAGGSGADSLAGGDGNDTVTGGDGDDTIDGGTGADVLTGGLGSDRFIGLGIGDIVDGSEDTPSNENDILDLFGSGWTKANTNILYAGGNDEAGTVEFLNNLGQVIGTLAFSNIETVIPCFTTGTRIDTINGPVAVERLRQGDLILTRDSGYKALKWIGRRDLNAVDLIARPEFCPVLIPAGALGAGSPARNLVVSPQHRVLVTGARSELMTGEVEVLVPALHLIGHGGTRRMAPSPVSYFHLLFDAHEIVRSDGAWSESFQPGGDALDSMDSLQRREVLALFPELRLECGPGLFPAARISLKRHEAYAVLADQRHRAGFRSSGREPPSPQPDAGGTSPARTMSIMACVPRASSRLQG